MIDEWLRTAMPPSNNPQVIMHYNEWAQPLSQSATATSGPDHPADWTRYRYLWETRTKWTSTKLCTLGEFIDHRLANKALTGCASALPAWVTQTAPPPKTPAPSPVNPTKGNTAVDKARKELAQTQAAEIARVQKAENDR